MSNQSLFDLYTDYLIANMGKATATDLSRLLDEAVSHDRISRMLGHQQLSQKDYWKCIKPIIRKIEQESGLIKVDDTIEEKPHSTENDIICWHWDHSSEDHVKGINIINFLYESSIAELDRPVSIPVAFEIIEKTEQFYDPKTKKVKRRSPRKKNEIVRERLRILHAYNKVKFRYVLWDSWFSSNDNFEMVHYELKKYFVAALKANRKVALSWEDKLAGKFHQVRHLDELKDRCTKVWIKGLDFPVMLTKRVFTNKDHSTGEQYIVTNDLELCDAILTSATYDKRWDVEVFHRGLKQNVGLEKSPTKNEITQANHIFAAMIAWAKLELLSLKHQIGHYALKYKLYVNALKASFDQLQQLKNTCVALPADQRMPTPLLG